MLLLGFNTISSLKIKAPSVSFYVVLDFPSPEIINENRHLNWYADKENHPKI